MASTDAPSTLPTAIPTAIPTVIPTSSTPTSSTSDTAFVVLAIILIGMVVIIIFFVCKAKYGASRKDRGDGGGEGENLLCFCLKPSEINENCDGSITFCDEHCCYFCSLRSCINSPDRFRYLLSSSSSSYTYSRTLDERSEYRRAELNSPHFDNSGANSYSNNNNYNNNNNNRIHSTADFKRNSSKNNFVLDDDIWDESIEIGIIGSSNNQSTSQLQRIGSKSPGSEFGSVSVGIRETNISYRGPTSSNDINSGNSSNMSSTDSKETISALHSI